MVSRRIAAAAAFAVGCGGAADAPFAGSQGGGGADSTPASGGASNTTGFAGSQVSVGGAGQGGGNGGSSTVKRDAAVDVIQDASAFVDAGRCGTMYPAQCLNLMGWKLTLPTGSPGNPNEIEWPALRTFSINPYFQLNPAGPGVVFQANAGGVSTSNSEYPRSELREMSSDGKKEAAWSTVTGTHTLLATEAFTHLPVAKPEAVAAQVHNHQDDVIMVRLNASQVFVEHNGKNLGDLAPTYKVGTVFNLKIEVSGGHIRVFYNDMVKPKVDVPDSSSCGSSGSPECYFKAGVYTQSNTSTGDKPTAYGEVVISDLSVMHE